MIRSLFWFVHRSVNAAVSCRPLFSENTPLLIAKYVMYCGISKKKEIKIKYKDQIIIVRTSTNDLKVAVENMSDEFEHVAEILDSDVAFIIDAGGYIGTSALSLARRFPRADVVVLEPSLENFRLLLKNTSGVNRIKPLRKALGASRGIATLRESGTGEWGFSLFHRSEDAARGGLGEVVEVTTIEDLLAEAHHERVGLLKLDIEGSELLVFAPGPAAVSRVDALVCELHERIAPGATRALIEATRGWQDHGVGREKIFTARRRE